MSEPVELPSPVQLGDSFQRNVFDQDFRPRPVIESEAAPKDSSVRVSAKSSPREKKTAAPSKRTASQERIAAAAKAAMHRQEGDDLNF